MPSPFAGVWWHRVRGGLSARPGLSDAELLGRYAAGADPDAFAGLVHRHGPTVLGVCRRILGDGPDADDAFQATFLVLVRRAKNVQDPSRLAGWLFGVAYRTAREVRTIRSARRRREVTAGTLPDRPAPEPPPPVETSAVDAELARLSEKYRAAVVLCDVEGLTRPAAAARLGIPEGTLSSRLAAARRQLADRLGRKGATLAAVGGLATVPDRLVGAVLDGPVSESVSLLTRRVEKIMTRSHSVLVSIGALAAVGGVALGLAAAGPPPDGLTSAAAPVAAAAEDKYNLADVPPVVVKTVPSAGAAEVDPMTKDVRVTFSKEMTDKSWSWATDNRYGNDLPEAGDVAYDKEKKTCVFPVKLEPGKTYAVWINSEKFANFKDVGGRPAVPYLLVFTTAKK
jgi:RNA polymerase sigma factor (sigma-70 family)